MSIDLKINILNLDWSVLILSERFEGHLPGSSSKRQLGVGLLDAMSSDRNSECFDSSLQDVSSSILAGFKNFSKSSLSFLFTAFFLF
jgi:hypothetical protein